VYATSDVSGDLGDDGLRGLVILVGDVAGLDEELTGVFLCLGHLLLPAPLPFVDGQQHPVTKLVLIHGPRTHNDLIHGEANPGHGPNVAGLLL